MACPCCQCPCGQARNSSGTCVAFAPSFVAVGEWLGKTLPQPPPVGSTITWQDPPGAGSNRPNVVWQFTFSGRLVGFKTVNGVCYAYGTATTFQQTSEATGDEANDCAARIVWEWRVDASSPESLSGNTYTADVVFLSGEQKIGFGDNVALSSPSGVCLDGIPPTVTVTFAP